MDASLLPRRPWWKLWELDSGEARRPHAPGVTLVYFTLASLPLFGLGQWFVPAVDEDRRAGLFLYFLAYIASGMGLLLATSFLNLRRYLRQRKVRMPAAMTATWLSTGAILIVGLTAAAAVLPLPVANLRALARFHDRVKATSGPRRMRFSRIAAFRARGPRAKVPPRRSPGSNSRPPARPRARERRMIPMPRQQTNGKGKPGGNSGQGRSKSGDAARQARGVARWSAGQERSPAGSIGRSREEKRSVRRSGQGRSSQGPGRPLQGRGRARKGRRAGAPNRARRKVRNRTTRSHRERIRIPAMGEVRRCNSHRSRSWASSG